MNNILKVEGLSKSYGDFSLTDVTFSLPEECITGFIGINGAGKTTTLRTLLGLTSRSSGNIQFFGLDIDRNEKQIKDRIGVVLDDGCFYDELTLAEMKRIIASAYTSWSEQDFKRYMDMFSLDPKQKINMLSKGMKMKYALALALSHNAELLIMDEPTSGLDPLIRSQLLKILADYMANGGKGVFFSTHITSDLDKIADMLIMIDKGHIIFQEEKDALLDTYRIVKGDMGQLTDDMRKCFLNISETAFGFTGITKQAAEIQRYFSDIIIERPTIEDIMLANIGREQKMMLFSLLKKDFLIVKKYVFIMLIAAVLIPPFMLWRTPEFTGVLGFILSIIFAVFMLLQYVSLKEYQFPKAATLLCATPFSRKMLVLSKYVFCMVIFLACCIIFGIETLIIPGLGSLDMNLLVLMLFVISVFIGIYLPVQYKFGYEKTKFAFAVIIMASPFILPQLLRMNKLDLVFFFDYSPILIYAGVILISLVVLAISAFLSMKFYDKADLA